MGTKISAMIAVTAGNLDDTALFETTDKNVATRKATVAQLRVAIAASAIAFLSTVTVGGTLAVTGATTLTGAVVVAGSWTQDQGDTASISNIGNISGTNTDGRLRLLSGSNRYGWEISSGNYAYNALSFIPASAVGGLSFATAAMTLSQTGQLNILSTTQSTSTTTGAIVTAGGLGVAKDAFFGGKITTLGGATFLSTSSALTTGAGAGAGTITNAPSAGNPTKWVGINDNGTTRYIPAW